MKKTYQGSCHCGAIKFEADLDLSQGTTRCNCRFCSKARFWMAFAQDGDFRLLQGADMLTDYQHTPSSKPEPFLHLLFCNRCGMRAFSRGGVMPGATGPFHAINIASLDNATDAELAAAPIKYADGRHDDWPSTPAETRHL
ncbi:MAG TPA: GFA family protein [Polyangia bacterium]|jgi:hypothetical protein|nr:GFA family protein [Polyangia bacterium]